EAEWTERSESKLEVVTCQINILAAARDTRRSSASSLRDYRHRIFRASLRPTLTLPSLRQSCRRRERQGCRSVRTRLSLPVSYRYQPNATRDAKSRSVSSSHARESPRR